MHYFLSCRNGPIYWGRRLVWICRISTRLSSIWANTPSPRFCYFYAIFEPWRPWWCLQRGRKAYEWRGRCTSQGLCLPLTHARAVLNEIQGHHWRLPWLGCEFHSPCHLSLRESTWRRAQWHSGRFQWRYPTSRHSSEWKHADPLLSATNRRSNRSM